MVQGENYNFRTDNWSIGVLTYESRMDTLNSIITADIQYPEDMSGDAKDFINKLLQLDPDSRLHLREALQHPFITKHNP
jgi:serine/threonine protein kinase